MGQVISSFVGCLGVQARRDGMDSKSLIFFPDLGFSPPLVVPSSVSHPPLYDDHNNLRSSVADNSCMPCLDEETGTADVEEIKDAIVNEYKPTEQADTMTKVDFVNVSDADRAMTSRETILIERKIGAYTSFQRILLVGEGDFSFSASLARAFSSAANIIATSLDSHEYLSRNYSHAIRNISELTKRGGTVLHGVDCTKMDSVFSSMCFERVIYNFPHAGFYGRNETRDSQLTRHRALVRLFLANAKRLVKRKGGEIHVTHKSWGFFLEWDIKSLASNEGLLFLEEVPFNRDEYKGYHTMYGYGGNKPFNCNPSKTYKFGHSHCL